MRCASKETTGLAVCGKALLVHRNLMSLCVGANKSGPYNVKGET